jgi:hypothetical protein
MPFTADQIIGKQIFAKLPVEKLSTSFTRLGTIQPGLIGVVFSYLSRPDGVYWLIGSGPVSFLVKHNAARISLDVQERRELEQKEKQKREKELIQQKGAIPFYIEKYGRWVLIFAVGSIVLKSVLKK